MVECRSGVFKQLQSLQAFRRCTEHPLKICFIFDRGEIWTATICYDRKIDVCELKVQDWISQLKGLWIWIYIKKRSWIYLLSFVCCVCHFLIPSCLKKRRSVRSRYSFFIYLYKNLAHLSLLTPQQSSATDFLPLLAQAALLSTWIILILRRRVHLAAAAVITVLLQVSMWNCRNVDYCHSWGLF